MTHRLRLPVPSLMLAAAGLFAAAGASAQTFTDSLVAAYQNRPELAADRARQRSLDEDVSRARGGWKPQISLSGQYGLGKDRLTYGYLSPPETVRETIYPKDYAVQLSQPIYDGGKTNADIDHAKYAVDGGIAHLETVETEVLGDAVQAYYDLYRDQQILAFNKASVTTLREGLSSVQARFQRQDVTVADVAESQSRLARGLAEESAAEEAVEVSESAFRQATGLVAGALPPPPPLPLALLPGTVDQAVALAINNPTVQEAQYAVKMAEADEDGAESGLKPQLSLQLSDQYLYETSQGHFTSQYQEGLLNLNIPLYTGGVDYAKVREAKQIIVQRQHELDEDRQQAMDKVKRALDQIAAAREHIVMIRDQVGYAQRALTAISTEVRVGTREVIDQLNAEQELLDAKIALAQAQHDEGAATYSAMSLIGRLDARSLRLPVQYYDPAINYNEEAGRWVGTGIPSENSFFPASQTKSTQH